MIDEQIKSEIAKQINDKFKTLEKSFEIFSLPLISQYRVLSFYGTANGTFLIPGFNIKDIIGKTLVLKSFRIVNYALTAQFRDISFSDGTTELIPQYARLDRLFDSYQDGTLINFQINGSTLSMFGYFDSGLGYLVGFPADLFVDNIYYKHSEKLQTMTLQITTEVFENIATGSVSPPLVKAVIECYLI